MGVWIQGGRLSGGPSMTEIEPYAPRDIGRGWAKCLVCGGDEEADMAAFVPDKETGERVVALFAAEGATAFLDYRPSEPSWVQVKVGACRQHRASLDRLYDLTQFIRHVNRYVVRDALRQSSGSD